jgi:hypothetical protein
VATVQIEHVGSRAVSAGVDFADLRSSLEQRQYQVDQPNLHKEDGRKGLDPFLVVDIGAATAASLSAILSIVAAWQVSGRSIL